MSSKKRDRAGPRKPRFPELPPKYSASRELRNKAEKLRRDRLNKLIDEIRTLVPIICTKTKKSETTRSNILRLTANFLRVQRLFSPTGELPSLTSETGSEETSSTAVETFTPATSASVSSGDNLQHLESMEGFFFMVAEDGRILFISENVDKFIGYAQIELMGYPIYHFSHPADVDKVKATLVAPRDAEAGEEERRHSFYLRLREKPLAKQDKPQYQHLHVIGRRKRVGPEPNGRSSRGAALCSHTFVGVMQPVRDRPITELSLVESVQEQYITRHLPDGRIIYADHRISTVAGYLPGEVQGKSAFNFFNAEDLPWTIMAMRHMFASSNGEGSTVYRLVTQTGELICLETKGYLEFNKTTNKIETFICINTVVPAKDEEKYLSEQKERFSPFITEVQIDAMKNVIPNGITFSPGSALGLAPALGSAPVSVISGHPRPSPPSPLSPRAASKRAASPSPGEPCKRAARTPEHYLPRPWPMHRVEGGRRVVDVEQVLPPPFPDALGPGQGNLGLEDIINEHNEEYLRQLAETPTLPSLGSLQLDLPPPLVPATGRHRSVIRSLPPQGESSWRNTEDRRRGHLIAERLKLLASGQQLRSPGPEEDLLSLMEQDEPDLVELGAAFSPASASRTSTSPPSTAPHS